MAKGQLRSNREAKKPKKKKEAVVAPSTFGRGPSTLTSGSKKKG